MRFIDNYHFLSNMYPCKVVYNGYTYLCSESAFQAQKSKQFEKFVNLNGFQAKKLGKLLPLRNDWEDVKISIMRSILVEKFKDNELREKLLSVQEPIVEDNTWHDIFWGRCNSKGQNHLGKLLESVKIELEF